MQKKRVKRKPKNFEERGNTPIQAYSHTQSKDKGYAMIHVHFK